MKVGSYILNTISQLFLNLEIQPSFIEEFCPLSRLAGGFTPKRKILLIPWSLINKCTVYKSTVWSVNDGAAGNLLLIKFFEKIKHYVNKIFGNPSQRIPEGLVPRFSINDGPHDMLISFFFCPRKEMRIIFDVCKKESEFSKCLQSL